MTSMARILGIDPGLRRTGWGVAVSHGSRLTHVAHGVIAPDPDASMAERLAQLAEGLAAVLERYKPHEAAVEETFVNADPRSALKLGMARGVCLLAPARAGLPAFEYAPRLVKKSVCGAGGAEKSQVAAMVRLLMPAAGPVSADAADALAVAITHAHHRLDPRMQAGRIPAKTSGHPKERRAA